MIPFYRGPARLHVLRLFANPSVRIDDVVAALDGCSLNLQLGVSEGFNFSVRIGREYNFCGIIFARIVLNFNDERFEMK